MRAFVAAQVPDPAKAGLETVQERLRRAGVEAGWARPAGMHLTLKFLGEVELELASRLLDLLPAALAGCRRFVINVEGVGTFPNVRNPRVVWAGIAGEVDRLMAVQGAVEQTAAGLGVAPEGRPFAPHLTLGRIRRVHRADRWLQALDELRGFRLPGFEVDAVLLMESELKPSGAVHREIGRVGLD